jgi:hypothetical protein
MRLKMGKEKSPPHNAGGDCILDQLRLVSCAFSRSCIASGRSRGNNFASSCRQLRAVSKRVLTVWSRRFRAVSGNNKCCIAFNNDFRAVSKRVLDRSSGFSSRCIRCRSVGVFRHRGERCGCDQSSCSKSENTCHSFSVLENECGTIAAPLNH